jgi:Uma2 family endonuclease
VANTATEPAVVLPLTVQLEPVVRMSDDEFFEFCAINRDLRVERTAKGELVIMSPTGGEAGGRSAAIIGQLWRWAREDGRGVAFDSSTGFVLPNGAIRSPDAAWVERSRLAALAPAERTRFLPLAPDAAIELRSSSDDLRDLQAKMEEYLANGTRLGLLVDAEKSRAHVYRPGAPAETLDAPAAVSGEPVLPGFRLSLQEIWDLGW